MKKLMISFCLLLLAIGVQAQFEQGKWIINPSITGLNLSHSSFEDTRFGVNTQIGAFVVKNTAVMVTLGGDWADAMDSYNVGVGGRYYFDKIGIYLGAGGKLNHLRPKHLGSITDFAIASEAGYAFFITKTITLEPAVYYDLSLKDSDYSKIGLKLGFALYF